MDKMNEAIRALHEVDLESAVRRKNTGLHPLSIFLVTVGFLVVTASFGKYEIEGLSSMILFLLVTGILCDISFVKGFRRLKYIFLLLLIMGIANPILDRQIVFTMGKLPISGGMVSMATLWIKGVFMVYAAYFMVVRIGMEGLCQALRTLHMPAIFITLITLTYRYIIVLLREIERMWTAYHMRAPGQKGVHVSAWGPFLGLLLFRSMDRANQIYDSMQLRGYREEIGIPVEETKHSLVESILYILFWGVVFWLLRSVPVFSVIGNLALPK